MTPEQLQEQMYEDEVRAGLERMGPFASWILDGKLVEMQRKAYAQGIDIQTKVVQDWIQLRRDEILKSHIHGTDYAIGVANTLTDLDHFLNEITEIQPK